MASPVSPHPATAATLAAVYAILIEAARRAPAPPRADRGRQR